MMLSIILPVYNAEKYLEKCLKSILSQSYSDFEVILINDGSKDSSNIICETYANEDSRIVYINQINQGVAMARNIGLKSAKGTYIGFVDADDVIEDSMFQNLIYPTTKNEFDVVIAHYKIYNQNDFHIPKTKIPTNKLLDHVQIKNHILKSFYTGLDPIVPALWNKIYTRNFLEEYGHRFHNQKGVRASDYWFNFEVFKSAKKVYVIEEANYHYNNLVNDSIINTFRENQFEVWLESQKKLINENHTFKFDINFSKFYKPFFDNTNYFILSALSKKGYIKGYDFIKPILLNERFKTSYQHILNKKLHLKIIHFFIKNNMILLSYLMFCIWHVTVSATKKD